MLRGAGRRASALRFVTEHRLVLLLAVVLCCGALLGQQLERRLAASARRAELGAQLEGAATRHECAACPACAPAACAACECPAPAPPPACAPAVPAAAAAAAGPALSSFYSHDPALRPVPAAMADARVCMVVRTFAGHRNVLMSLLSSVLLWGHPHLRVTLLDTGKDGAFTELPMLAQLASAMAGRPDAVRVSAWTHATSRALFPGYTDEDHGYVATDLTLEDILAERRSHGNATTGGPAPCEYMIVTNGDNLYGKEYLAATLDEISRGAEMVSTHWVSHYEMNKAWILGWGEIQNGHCGPWRPGRDGEVAASPIFMKGCVDLGVVTFKSALLEETGFRFAVDRLRTIPPGGGPPKEMFAGMNSLFYADGAFFERVYGHLKERGRMDKAKMIRRALFVHQ